VEIIIIIFSPVLVYCVNKNLATLFVPSKLLYFPLMPTYKERKFFDFWSVALSLIQRFSPYSRRLEKISTTTIAENKSSRQSKISLESFFSTAAKFFFFCFHFNFFVGEMFGPIRNRQKSLPVTFSTPEKYFLKFRPSSFIAKLAAYSRLLRVSINSVHILKISRGAFKISQVQKHAPCY
jgi:hypothetical protein